MLKKRASLVLRWRHIMWYNIFQPEQENKYVLSVWFCFKPFGLKRGAYAFFTWWRYDISSTYITWYNIFRSLADIVRLTQLGRIPLSSLRKRKNVFLAYRFDSFFKSFFPAIFSSSKEISGFNWDNFCKSFLLSLSGMESMFCPANYFVFLNNLFKFFVAF